MTDNINPYIPAKAGDLITSEIWNDVQVDIKKDIQNSIQEAKEDIKKNGVDKAADADKLCDKAPEEWKKVLDNLYAPKVHSHEGQSVYQKYFNRFDKGRPSVFLKHNLGAFPIVDVYELTDVFNGKTFKDVKSSDGKPPKFFLYFDHEDRDKYEMYTEVYRDRVNLGVCMGKVLKEYKVVWEERDSFEDVVNDLWDKLLAPTHDEISHAVSFEIARKFKERVSKLIKEGEWDDIYLAFRPQKCTWISCRSNNTDVNPDDLTTKPLKVTHINYNTLLLEINDKYFNQETDDYVDIMTLLRI